MIYITEKQLEPYMSLFKERTDVYAKKWKIQYIGRIQRSNTKKYIYDYRDKNVVF